MRARVFLLDPKSDDHLYGGELDANDADDVWQHTEANPGLVGRKLRAGDIIYLEDVYLRMDGDGGWHPITPGDETARLYAMIP